MILSWFKKKSEPPPPSEPAPATRLQDARPVAVPAASKGAALSKILGEEGVELVPPGLGKEAAIEWLLRRLCERRGLGDPARFLAKVLEREQGISTTLDTGLAVPHARMDGLDSLCAALGVLPKGLPDPKQPDLVIRVIFLFLSPNRQDAFTQHLHLLRQVSALFQPAFLAELAAADSASRIYRMLCAKESGA